MRIGVPKETERHEHRVGLTPFGVSRLCELGCDVFVEHDAGVDSHFTAETYARAGATVVYQADEVYGRADLVVKVGKLTADEARLMPHGSAVAGFLHMAVMPSETVASLEEREITAVGYEVIEDDEGAHPVLRALSEIAGQMAVHRAAELLAHENGGRGIILGNVAGVPPSTFVVLGAGVAGWTAARTALACGAHVIVLDQDLERLRHAIQHGCDHAVTALASPRNLERYIPIADVVVGAVLVPGARAPFLIREPMVRDMKPGSVILDLAIDQGGCVETSRPTTFDNPTFRVHDVVHYCVPNMTSNVPRTASRATTLAAIPYLGRMAWEGIDGALRSMPDLARGVYMFRGRMTHRAAALALGKTPGSLSDLLG